MGEESTIVTETTSPPKDVNPRIERLILAEKEVLDAGGCCIRLAGLYSLDRGAHNFWITKGDVSNSKNGLINQLHYDDAASICIAALKQGPESTRCQVYIASDGMPMTRYDICASALRTNHYRDYDMPTFMPDKEDQPHGKVYDGSWTNEQLHWQPKYRSLEEFMKLHH